MRKWRKDNPHKVKGYARLAYQKDSENIKKKVIEYRRKHPGIDLQHRHKRRAQKLSNGGSYTLEELQEQFKAQDKRCFHCGKWLLLGNGKFCHIDHWIPLSKGGTSNIENIKLLCPSCNLSKGDKLPHEWHSRYRI